MTAPRLVPEAGGSLRVIPGDAWWCVDCGRLRLVGEWDRCEPCTATTRAEAARLADVVMPGLTDPDTRRR